jgi:hypothetical protein
MVTAGEAGPARRLAIEFVAGEQAQRSRAVPAVAHKFLVFRRKASSRGNPSLTKFSQPEDELWSRPVSIA